MLIMKRSRDEPIALYQFKRHKSQTSGHSFYIFFQSLGHRDEWSCTCVYTSSCCVHAHWNKEEKENEYKRRTCVLRLKEGGSHIWSPSDARVPFKSIFHRSHIIAGGLPATACRHNGRLILSSSSSCSFFLWDSFRQSFFVIQTARVIIAYWRRKRRCACTIRNRMR